MSSPPSHPIDFTKLELAVELPPGGNELPDFGEMEGELDYEDEFAFTEEYKFSQADPDPPTPPPQPKYDVAEFSKWGVPIPTFEPPPLVQIQVRTIDRELIPWGEFHDYMDNVCEDFLQFSVAVFTRNGRIRNSLVKPGPGTHRGTGVWGAEINHGKLAYIETIKVLPKYQRQGVGRWAFEALLRSPALSDCPYIFTWATALETPSLSTTPDPDYARKTEGVTAFWRALGFRRVGGTWFFGYARDPGHPMRSLPAADDADVSQMTAASSEDVILSQHQGWPDI